ncbi:hypothetical protein Q5752_004611 [Cryptotrichosporon argae]
MSRTTATHLTGPAPSARTTPGAPAPALRPGDTAYPPSRPLQPMTPSTPSSGAKLEVLKKGMWE